MSGAYELPFGFTVSANEQYYTGYPEMTTVVVGSQTVKLTQVSQTLVVQPSGTIRQPNVNIVDLNLKRALKFRGMTVYPRVDVFNVLNTSGIQSYITQLGPTYGNAITILDGRLIKFGANLNW
jgi:hypothetical protein